MTGIYNQWPIILSGNQHHVPIDHPPAEPYRAANENWHKPLLDAIRDGLLD